MKFNQSQFWSLFLHFQHDFSAPFFVQLRQSKQAERK